MLKFTSKLTVQELNVHESKLNEIKNWLTDSTEMRGTEAQFATKDNLLAVAVTEKLDKKSATKTFRAFLSGNMDDSLKSKWILIPAKNPTPVIPFLYSLKRPASLNKMLVTFGR